METALRLHGFLREIGYSFRFFFTRKPHPESVSVVESKSSSIPYQATPSMQYRTVPQQDQRMSLRRPLESLNISNTPPPTQERAVSPHLEPTFPQQHLKPGVESQRPLSEGEDLDLGYYRGPQPAYPPQPPQQLQPGITRLPAHGIRSKRGQVREPFNSFVAVGDVIRIKFPSFGRHAFYEIDELIALHCTAPELQTISLLSKAHVDLAQGRLFEKVRI
ncbi:hypothetical protein D9611_015114 [Ephemerocybe angulata]|uniref:Uncharacterized protein n=1 Tax=Ephemerocybe angulata TaxID=980116 RepID=A0A8H5C9A7_9AGAR|nr:hypothetical protein D9611_015114 [Tulosesus angulatus]